MSVGYIAQKTDMNSDQLTHMVKALESHNALQLTNPKVSLNQK